MMDSGNLGGNLGRSLQLSKGGQRSSIVDG